MSNSKKAQERRSKRSHASKTQRSKLGESSRNRERSIYFSHLDRRSPLQRVQDEIAKNPKADLQDLMRFMK